MRQSKFTESQIVSILKEADAGRPVNEIWRRYGISSATCDKWKAKSSGVEASDVKRLKELEYENSRLKRMYAELSLENASLNDVIATKLLCLLGAGKSPGLSSRHRSSNSACLASGEIGPGHIPSATDGVGAAGCARDRRAEGSGQGTPALGILEVLASAPSGWAPVERETIQAHLLPAALESAPTD